MVGLSVFSEESKYLEITSIHKEHNCLHWITSIGCCLI